LNRTPPFAGDGFAPYKGKSAQNIKRKFKADNDVLRRFGERLDGTPRPNKTQLARAVDIRWDQFLVYFNHLLGNGHIESVDDDDDETFRKTALGRDLFNTVERLHAILTRCKPITLSSVVTVTAVAVWIATYHI
jgi:predicted transcriptional regulator